MQIKIQKLVQRTKLINKKTSITFDRRFMIFTSIIIFLVNCTQYIEREFDQNIQIIKHSNISSKNIETGNLIFQIVTIENKFWHQLPDLVNDLDFQNTYKSTINNLKVIQCPKIIIKKNQSLIIQFQINNKREFKTSFSYLPVNKNLD
ncbi:MAG: hypothetical protein SFU98_16680 [Leptospiraceae bacterium]|nr:hypothetical protein [Leptospiraceae bacterium]